MRDDTNDTDRNGPEDDECSDEANDCVATDDLLPPRDAQVGPNNLLRADTDNLGAHVEGSVVSNSLVSSLGIGLGFELNEDGTDLLEVSSDELSLGGFGLGDTLVQLVAAPFDSVDLLADQTKETKTVRRALLVGDPARNNVSGFGISFSLRSAGGIIATLLESLVASLVHKLDQLDFGTFELQSSLVTLANELVELLRVTSDPDMTDDSGVHGAKAALIEVVGGDVGEQNNASREAVTVEGREQESLAQVDVENALASNCVHDEEIHSPTDKDVSVEVVRLAVDVHVAVSKALKLTKSLATSGVDGEQDGPGDAERYKRDGGSDSEVANEQISVETLVLKSIGIWELPERAEPVEPSIGQLRTLLAV